MINFGKILLWVSAVSFVVYMLWPAARLIAMIAGAVSFGAALWWNFSQIDKLS